MSKIEIPSVEYLTCIEADNAGTNADVLHYNKLLEGAADYAKDRERRIDAFLEKEPGSLEELVSARQLAFEYLVDTAVEVVASDSHNRDLWADRYTQASVELFGAPDKAEATREAGRQARALDRLRGDRNVDQEKLDFVLTEYGRITGAAPEVIHDEADRKNEADYQPAVNALRDEAGRRYSPVLDIVDRAGEATFTPAGLADIFASALETMAVIDDTAWSQWQVVQPEEGTSVSVRGKKNEIRVPQRRGPAGSTEVKKLLGHELLTHALRAKNGRQNPDERYLKGFPNYLSGEEGLAILMGAATSDGKVPQTVHDRYLDVALAMGVVGDAPKKRHELFDLVHARRLVLAQQNGSVDEAALQVGTSKYVDRIYRGSPGDDIGTRQAVFTGDITYYRYRDIASYIADKLREGHAMPELFDYLMQGKFDPTNSAHAARVERTGTPLTRM